MVVPCSVGLHAVQRRLAKCRNERDSVRPTSVVGSLGEAGNHVLFGERLRYIWGPQKRTLLCCRINNWAPDRLFLFVTRSLRAPLFTTPELLLQSSHSIYTILSFFFNFKWAEPFSELNQRCTVRPSRSKVPRPSFWEFPKVKRGKEKCEVALPASVTPHQFLS